MITQYAQQQVTGTQQDRIEAAVQATSNALREIDQIYLDAFTQRADALIRHAQAALAEAWVFAQKATEPSETGKDAIAREARELQEAYQQRVIG